MPSAIRYYSGLSQWGYLRQHSRFLQVLRLIYFLQPTRDNVPSILTVSGHSLSSGVTVFPSGLEVCALCAMTTAGMEDRSSVHMALVSMLTALSLDRYTFGFVWFFGI